MRFDFTKDEHDFFVEHCRFNPENGELAICDTLPPPIEAGASCSITPAG